MTAVGIITAPVIGEERRHLTVPEGMTIAEIVSVSLPSLAEGALNRVRVVIVGERGSAAVPAERWARVRPRAGTQVLVRLVPGGDALKSIVGVLVSVAAFAIGQFWLGPLLQGFGLSAGLANGLATGGLMLLGSFLLGLAFKPKAEKKERPTFAIGAFRNEARPDGAVPLVLGKVRTAPPYVGLPYTEVVGDDMYVRAAFVVGYGPLALSDFRLGETPLSKYQGVELELRYGVAEDTPLVLYPRQVFEHPEAAGADLTRPLPRDALGEIIDGAPGEETPVTRYTARDVDQISVIIGFPAGLLEIDKKGKPKDHKVSVRIRHRLVGTLVWTDVVTLDIVAKRREALYRQHTWAVGVRGAYEVELTRMTDEASEQSVSDRCVLVAFQSMRPEYGIAFDKPLALIGIRIKATHQLNGQLDQLNCLASCITDDWDEGTSTWIARETRNPAAAYLRLLQGPAVRYPYQDQISYVDLREWSNFCVAKGLHYDRVLEGEAALLDQLAEVAEAGRASPQHDGRYWSVIIDRPRTLVVDHVNTRNSRAFRWQRSYARHPDAIRVPFLDGANDYKPAERIVPWPGHSGPIDITEEWTLAGKTDAAEVWRETRRRQYAVVHRPDIFWAVQDGEARFATRGDHVMGSWDTIDKTMVVARVSAVDGPRVFLDSAVTMAADGSYAIRFRRFDAGDTIGDSIVRTVATVAGERNWVTLTGSGQAPAVDDIVHFGRAASDSLPLLIAGIEPAENGASRLLMQAMVPAIDTLTDAEVAPAWDGRVGEIGPVDMTPPGIPRFGSVSTGFSGTGAANGLQVSLLPGSGVTTRYVLSHRLAGGPTWTQINVLAGAGGVAIGGYSAGASVELMAWAVSPSGVAGTATSILTVTIGGADAPAAAALAEASIDVVGRLGHATIAFAVADPGTETVRILRDGTLIAEVPVSAGGTYGRVDGDSTRTNLLSGTWTLGAGWSESAGVLTRAVAAASAATRSASLSTGVVYRIGADLTVSSGNVTPKLTGGTAVPGSAHGTTGRVLERLTAASGNLGLELDADAAFAGSLADIVLIQETPACISQGAHAYQCQPVNADGVLGPLSATRTVSVV